MTDVKKLMEKIKSELEKLKSVEDDAVKKVVANVETYISEYTSEEKTEEEEKKEDKEVEEKKEEAEESEEKEEDEEESKEDESEEKEESDEEASEESAEEPKEVKKELSAEIADRFRESAIELDSMQKELDAVREINKGYEGKIVELQKELDVYKEKEQIELKAKFEAKVSNLIELYHGIGINKSVEDISDTFNEAQIDKLIGDLGAMQRTIKAKSVRQTRASAGLELSKYTQMPKETVTASNSGHVLFNSLMEDN